MAAAAIRTLITLYQMTFSPDHGVLRWFFPYGCCRYYPTCSQYCVGSIKRYGVFIGLLKGVRRLLRCNPFTSPRIDYV